VEGRLNKSQSENCILVEEDHVVPTLRLV
jgi:hypothetical protein